MVNFSCGILLENMQMENIIDRKLSWLRESIANGKVNP